MLGFDDGEPRKGTWHGWFDLVRRDVFVYVNREKKADSAATCIPPVARLKDAAEQQDVVHGDGSTGEP